MKADYNWGNALASEGHPDEAIAHFRNALKIRPNYARAYSSLGLVFFQKGDIKEAIEAWEKGLEVKPDQPDVQNNLAWLLATAPEDLIAQRRKGGGAGRTSQPFERRQQCAGSEHSGGSLRGNRAFWGSEDDGPVRLGIGGRAKGR